LNRCGVLPTPRWSLGRTARERCELRLVPPLRECAWATSQELKTTEPSSRSRAPREERAFASHSRLASAPTPRSAFLQVQTPAQRRSATSSLTQPESRARDPTDRRTQLTP